MQQRAEQSKNDILASLNADLMAVEAQIQFELEWSTIVSLVVVFIVVLILAILTGSWLLFISVFVYMTVMSIVYIQLTRSYARKRLGHARETVINFISSEEAILTLNGAGAAYLAA